MDERVFWTKKNNLLLSYTCRFPIIQISCLKARVTSLPSVVFNLNVPKLIKTALPVQPWSRTRDVCVVVLHFPYCLGPQMLWSWDTIRFRPLGSLNAAQLIWGFVLYLTSLVIKEKAEILQRLTPLSCVSLTDRKCVSRWLLYFIFFFFTSCICNSPLLCFCNYFRYRR